jgi:hemoglobin-like flavoprotein
MEQGRHFMLAISAVVTSLAAPEVIIPKLQQLGRRHQAYGIKPENYAVIKAALLYTLERVLHGDYTPEIEEAWSALYDWLVFIATDQQAFT